MLREHVWCVIPLYRFSKPEVSADSVILTLLTFRKNNIQTTTVMCVVG